MTRYGFSGRQSRGRIGLSVLQLFPPVFFKNDEEETPGGGGNNNPPAPPTSAADTLTRYGGDAVRMAERVSQLERDNYNVRESRRQDRARIVELEKQVAPENAVILTAEDAKAWEAYKVFGKPEEVKSTLDSGQAAISERDAFKKSASLEAAAKVAGFKPGVLRLLGKDLDIEVREIDVQKEDGTTEKKNAAFVKQKDAAGVASEKPLRDYFKEQGEDVLSSLEAGESQGNFDAQGAANNGQFTPFPAQSAGGGGKPQGYQPTNRYAHNIKKPE